MQRLMITALLAASLFQVGCLGLSTRGSPAAVQSQAAAFELADASAKPVSLASLLQAHDRTAVVFSRGSWCPLCKRHLGALAREHARFDQAGVGLVSISTDPVADNAQLTKELAIPFPLLADPDGKVAASYGVLAEKDHTGQPFAVPSVFIVDSGGTILWKHVGSYPWSTTSADDLLGAVDATRRR